MINYKDETLDKREIYIKKRYRPIKFSDKVKIKSVEDIFSILFNKNIYNSNAVLPHRSSTTFYADNPDKVHCEKYRSRSYLDAYLLTWYYFPSISYRKMYNLLKSYAVPAHKKWRKRIIKENNPFNRHQANWYPNPFWYCGTIGRTRFCYFYKLKFNGTRTTE